MSTPRRHARAVAGAAALSLVAWCTSALAASAAATPAPSATPASSRAPAKPAPPPGRVPHAGSPATTTGSLEFVMTASSMSLDGFTYDGVTTIASGSVASLPVMKFTMTGSSARGLSIQRGCSHGVELASSIPSSASASFAGPPVTLYLTELDGTDSRAVPQSFAFTVAGTLPPAAGWTLASAFTAPYTAVSMTAAEIRGGVLSLPHMTTTAAVC